VKGGEVVQSLVAASTLIAEKLRLNLIPSLCYHSDYLEVTKILPTDHGNWKWKYPFDQSSVVVEDDAQATATDQDECKVVQQILREGNW
jgi:hypothetical protein